MGKANDSIKYNKSYPELNGLDEGMIQHKERSGAKAAALIPATTFVASATAAVLLLLLALSRIALVRPKLIESTFNSAQVEIRTDLEGSEEAYPLVYLLMPYAVGRENPVTPGGRLRLTDEEVEALGEAVLRGEIFSEKELLLFQNLSNRTDYLMLFRSKDENGDWELRKEALFIPMMRQGTEKPTPVPDGSTPKGPVAISMTPMPGTPTPPADKKSATPTPDGTATPTPTATATPTPTPTPTPSGAPAPYVPTTTVPHGITIRIIGGGQGFAGTDPEHLSSASELQANPGETVYIKGVPEDTDDVHYLFARYEVTSGSVSNWTSSSFVMGNTDVELEFTFVRAYRLSVVNEMPEWGTATYQGGYQDFPAGESVSIHCEPSTHYEFVVAHDETEHYYFTDPDFTFPMPEQDLTLFVMFDKILVGLTIEPASGGSCSYSPDAELEVGNTYYFQEGSTVTIAATGAIEDHVFAGYYVNGSSTLITDDPLTLTMDADTTVTPVFSQLYTIRITNGAPDYGTVTCSGTTMDGDHPTVTVKAAEGETITFQASPVAGSEISGVEIEPPGAGTLASAGGTYTFTVGTGNATIYVYFGPKPGHQIHVSTVPDEDFLGFEISADIYGIDDTFPPGATVTITPELEGPYAYDHMVVNGGSYSNQSYSVNPVTITMPDTDVYVTIYFTEIQLYTINVGTDPTGIGADVEVSGTDVSYVDGFYRCPDGGTITLSVYSGDWEEEYRLVGYRIGGTLHSGSTYTCTVTSDMTVTAVFKSLWHEINVGTDPTGIGADVEVSGTDVSYVDGFYRCPDGGTITLSVYSGDWEEEYRLVGYRIGGTLHSGSTYTCTVTGDMTVTAVFERKYHNITIIGDPDGVANMPTHGPTLAGQPVSFHWDIADDNYQYTGYDISGEYSDLSVTDSTCSFTMGNTDVTFTAHFAVKTTTVGYSVYLDHAEPAGSATLYITPAPNGASNTYLPGTTVTLYAYENTGYAVDSISAGGVTIAGDSGSFTVTGDMPVVIYCHSLTPVTVSQPDAFGGSTYTGTTYHEPGSVFDIPVFPDPGCTYYLTVNGEAYAPGVSGVPVGTEPISVIVTFIPQ